MQTAQNFEFRDHFDSVFVNDSQDIDPVIVSYTIYDTADDWDTVPSFQSLVKVTYNGIDIVEKMTADDVQTFIDEAKDKYEAYCLSLVKVNEEIGIDPKHVSWAYGK